jgi:oligosaccharyltransferase complex subunit alpha (ribophorin I)
VFTSDNASAKSGATITYGPFSNIPTSATREFIDKHQQTMVIHYKYADPLLAIPNLKRSAEISHWGSNLNIQDEIWLHNAGPRYVLQFPGEYSER